jgi:hypothetical protein
LDFDVAASAGWYSAVAGLLAGFAFVAILLPLDHEERDGDEQSVGLAVLTFVCAFMSLTVLALSYAILAGRIGEGQVLGIAVHEQLVYGTAFGLSTLLVLLGLQAVLRSYGGGSRVFGPSRQMILRVTGAVGPVVLLGLLFSNSLDIERFRVGIGAGREQCALLGLPAGVLVNLGIIAAGCVAIGLIAGFERRLPRRRATQSALAKGVLGFTATALLWTSIAIPLLPLDLVTSAAFEHGAVLLSTLVTVLFAAGAWISR